VKLWGDGRGRLLRGSIHRSEGYDLCNSCR
jgi:hypothetical protein